MEIEPGTFTRIDLVYRCLADKTRTSALGTAINSTVQPGDTVADLGSGTGILALFAARAGARKVYAVEISSCLLPSIKKVVHCNGYDNVIQVIQDDAANFTINAPLDVVIAELLTTGLIDEDQVRVINSLWQKKLVHRDTRFIPCRVSTFAELIVTSFEFFGFDMPVIRHEYPGLANPEATALTNRLLVNSVDFRGPIKPQERIRLHFRAKTAGTANALRLTSVVHLTPTQQLNPTPFLNAPLVLPIAPMQLRPRQRVQVNLEYTMGHGLTSLAITIDDDSTYEKTYTSIQQFMKEVRKELPPATTHDPSADVVQQQDAMRRFDPERFIIGLNTTGCAFGHSNPCNHCGQLVPALRHFDTLERFRQDFQRYRTNPAPTLFLCTNGSWFDAVELPLKIREDIIEQVLNAQLTQSLILESRPEFVDHQGIAQLKPLLDAGIKITVGLGFDCLSEEVRELCLNKTIPTADYLQACRLLRSNGIAVCTYVVLKPPFLTEKQAIHEAVQTIKFAFDANSTSVFLEPLAIQRYTLQHELHQHGMFRPPWLWSIREVLRQVWGLGQLNIGGEFFLPPAYTMASNCPNCDQTFQESFLIFNHHNEQGYQILNKITCPCYHEWEKELHQEQTNLSEAITTALNEIKQRCQG